ncbi:DUF488 family protein, N3 subclade [Cohnella xylanilytica]|uniref:DUF488 family protein, N3 subclade n=1 Tax=Cohnella xylanilytica TaxID=557555 RepID=UPI001FE5A62C|nr:DUF488 family protein [Cohnella xylanilytica]
MNEDDSKFPLLQQLRKWAEEGTLTLLYSAKDEESNQAVVLAELLRGMDLVEDTASK